MSSTYTLNNGIELIGTGEQSGTWGATTNTNFELLDTALDGQVTITASSAGSSGSPNSLPVSDGAASNGRNRLVNITSGTDLGATVYYQLTPSDAEKIIYIRNSLNAQSLIVFQGTYNASNDYEIPNGKTAIIFFNGAGSGAVAANVMSNAHFDALNIVGNASVGGTLAVTSTSTFSDDVTFTGASYNVVWDKSDNALEFADNAKAVFGAGSDLQIYHDSADSIILDNGTGNLKIQADDLVLKTADGVKEYLKGTADGSVRIRYNNTIALETTDTGIDVTGNILRMDGTAPMMYFMETGVTDSNHRIRQNTGNLYFQKLSDDTNTATTRMAIDGGTGDISFYEDTGTTPKLFWDASAESLGIGKTDRTNVSVLTVQNVSDVSTNTAEFYNDNGNRTFRFAQDTSGNADLLLEKNDGTDTVLISTHGDSYFNGGNVGIGTNSPQARFQVSQAADLSLTNSDAQMRIEGNGYTGFFGLDGTSFQIGQNSSLRSMTFHSGSGMPERMRIDSSGVVRIGGQTGTLKLGNDATYYADIEWEYNNNELAFTANNTANFTFNSNGSERMRIDSSGNVSIGGFAPETWSLGKALHVGNAENALWGEGDYAFHMMQNAYYNGGWKYTHSDEANRFALEDGKFIWATASAGTADAALSFSERMRLANDGFLGIGTSTPRQLLHVNQQTTSSDAIIRITNSNTPASGGGHRVEFGDGTGTTEGSTLFRYAYIAGERSGGSNDGHFIVGTKPDNSTSPREHLRVSSSGELTITGTYNGNARDDAYVIFGIQNSNGDSKKSQIHAVKTADISSELIFSTTASHTFDERMRLDNAGNLLVGTNTKETQGVTLYGTGANGVYLKCTDTVNYWITRAGQGAGNGTIATIYSDTSVVGSITVTSSSTLYNTSSDYRLKTDAQPMTGASARVQALNPVNFEWVVDGTRVDGFLAHEAQEVVPEAVTGTKDAMRDEEYEVTPAVLDDDGNVVTEAVMGTRSVPDYQGIDQSKLVPLLTAALQEALTKIDALETRITALEG